MVMTVEAIEIDQRSEEFIQVRKDIHDEAMDKFLMAFILLEKADDASEGVSDTDGMITLMKCSREKMGDACQLFCDMTEPHLDGGAS
jgi:hypothetical protein